MKLYITSVPALRLTGETGEDYDTDKFYDLPDAPDHVFIIREFTLGGPLQIQIKKFVDGKRLKKPVQSAIIRRCSVAAGRGLNGDPIIKPYVLDLHPDKEIFPIATLIDQLMAMGIKNWMITPMFERDLHNCVARHSGPRMQSDVEVQYTDIPADGYFMSSRFFEVRDARWAILSFDESESLLSHIYLWPGAAEVSEEILEIVRSLKQAGAKVSA